MIWQKLFIFHNFLDWFIWCLLKYACRIKILRNTLCRWPFHWLKLILFAYILSYRMYFEVSCAFCHRHDKSGVYIDSHNEHFSHHMQASFHTFLCIKFDKIGQFMHKIYQKCHLTKCVNILFRCLVYSHLPDLETRLIW